MTLSRWPCGLRHRVCGPSIAGIVGLNPAEGMDIHLVFTECCVGSGLCDELIIHSEESYQVFV